MMLCHRHTDHDHLWITMALRLIIFGRPCLWW